MKTKLPRSASSRRHFLSCIGATGTLALGAGALGLESLLDLKNVQAAGLSPFSVGERRDRAAQIRQDAAQFNRQRTLVNLEHLTNGDEERYDNKVGSYSKGLKHNSNGEVDLSAYQSLMTALTTGQPSDFNAIKLGGERGLTNPQAGLAFELEGPDSHSFVQPPPPTFSSREAAAEIAENYWMALLRDVPFSQYGSHPLAHAAAADLTLFGADARVAKNGGGVVTPELLFRGLTPGDRVGPYLSQFFYLPCRFGAHDIDQRVHTARPGDFMTSYHSGRGNWLDVQRGLTPPQTIQIDPTPRYMRNGRDLGQWVHVDVLFQAYFQAMLVLFGLDTPTDTGNPYNGNPTQIGFGTFGGPHISALMCAMTPCALHTVWYQKWFVHRRLRPEVFAERVDRTAYEGAGYQVHPEILEDIASSSRLGGFLTPGNALLPMAYPEGSPTHPAYGAGHATVAGTCVTILKAWFNEPQVILNPIMPTDDGLSLRPYKGESLTVGGELNKLASNVALGRDFAGVHWRSDASESLRLGEAVAIQFLKEQSACFNENFTGFSLTKFDGTTITV